MAVPRLSVPKPPKPDRVDVYGKEERYEYVTNRNRMTTPKPAPKPERRPVDERGVVRLGPGGPAKPVPVKPKGTGRPDFATPRRDPGMNPPRPPRPVPGRGTPRVAPPKKRVAPKGKYVK
jgi:hypothetical protein